MLEQFIRSQRINIKVLLKKNNKIIVNLLIKIINFLWFLNVTIILRIKNPLRQKIRKKIKEKQTKKKTNINKYFKIYNKKLLKFKIENFGLVLNEFLF